MPGYYVFPLLQETIAYLPPHIITSNVPILVHSGEESEILHGFLVKNCITVRPTQSQVSHILLSPQPLVPGRFVVPPPYSNL